MSKKNITKAALVLYEKGYITAKSVMDVALKEGTHAVIYNRVDGQIMVKMAYGPKSLYDTVAEIIDVKRMKFADGGLVAPCGGRVTFSDPMAWTKLVRYRPAEECSIQ